ncbi:CDR2 isoform 3 [Pongo abelii]|uniref:CDR2 isoform 3 n=1 Tax=Pongo abelii TaxID=9601 RepID=A0A2J8RAD5_PONAB|nr:CDR2 isoform 3 [Pongo abelii]
MLAENLVEEFEMKEDEPWYDHQDLQQVSDQASGTSTADERTTRKGL